MQGGKGWTDMEDDDRGRGIAFATAWTGALALFPLVWWAIIGWAVLSLI